MSHSLGRMTVRSGKKLTVQRLDDLDKNFFVLMGKFLYKINATRYLLCDKRKANYFIHFKLNNQCVRLDDNRLPIRCQNDITRKR